MSQLTNSISLMYENANKILPGKFGMIITAHKHCKVIWWVYILFLPIYRKEELLNSVFSKSDFSLDEGEGLLREMQEVREELTKFGDFIQGITNQSREIIPLKQRKTNVVKPIHVTAICSY